MTTHRPRRGGFTLIELLIVIAILALLSALAVGGYMRIRQSQTASMTDKILANRNTALNRLWSAARDQADKEFRDDVNGCKSTLTNACGGDSDRAKAVYLYAKLKAEFPQTFWQAGQSVYLVYDPSQPPTGMNVALSIPPRKLFTSNRAIKAVANLPADPLFNLPAAEEDSSDDLTKIESKALRQSAALIYLILTERGARGEVDDAGSTKTAQIEPRHLAKWLETPPPPPAQPYEPMTAFADAWDQPIGFARWATNGDLQDPNNGYGRKGSKSADPFDPVGRLSNPANWSNRNAIVTSLFTYSIPPLPPAANPRRVPPTNPWVTNWVPTLISMGPDQKIAYSVAEVDQVTGLTLLRDADDEQFSYKQRREGNN